MNFEWKNSYYYYIIGAACVISLIFFNEEKMTVPKWPFLLAFLLMATIAMCESYEAWKRKGALIISDLGIEKGGSTGFNHNGDIRMARSNDGQPAFAVIATGGFDYAGFSVKGSENFLVVPPEHVSFFGGHLVIKTRLRNVTIQQLQPYIVNELNKLPKFKEIIVTKKHNLWFGMTSQYFGTDTQENTIIEETMLDRMAMSDMYRHNLKEAIDTKTRVGDFKNKDYSTKYKVINTLKDDEK